VDQRCVHAGQSMVVSEALVETFMVGETRKSVYKPLCFASPKIEMEKEERTLDKNRKSLLSPVTSQDGSTGLNLNVVAVTGPCSGRQERQHGEDPGPGEV
jgi:hypothetical protein